jgi:hypothetical protein
MLGPSITQTVQNPKLNWSGNPNTLLSTRIGNQVLNFFSSPNKNRDSPNNGLYVYAQRRAVCMIDKRIFTFLLVHALMCSWL